MNNKFLSYIVWFAVAVLGAAAIGGIALNRGESINAIWFVTAALCVYAIAYRFYAAWISSKVLLMSSRPISLNEVCSIVNMQTLLVNASPHAATT